MNNFILRKYNLKKLFNHSSNSKYSTINCNRRVVITGIGCVSPLGTNKEQLFANLKEGKSGIIDLKDKSYYKDLPTYCKLGAPIINSYKPKFKTLGTDNLVTQIALSATREALDDANLTELLLKKELNPYKIGIITGTSAPSINCIINNSLRAFAKKDYNYLDRMGMFKILTNLINYNISSMYNIKGITSALSLSCASGLNSVGEGTKSIQSGEVNVILIYNISLI